MTKSKDSTQSTGPGRRIRITRTGCIFALLSGIVCVAAFNTGVNLLYLLMSTLLSTLTIAYVLPALSIKRISGQRSLPPHISAGSSFPVELSIHNRKRRLTSLFVILEDHVVKIEKGQEAESKRSEVRNEKQRMHGRSRLRSLLSFLFRSQPVAISRKPDHAAHFRCFVERTKPGETIRRRYTIRFPRRGLYRFYDLRASTKFPFGLFCGSNELDAQNGRGENVEEAIVYPAYGKLLMGEAEVSKIDVSYMGSVLSKGYGEEEFYGLREYRPGDNPRRIHWKSSARLSKPLVKELDSNIAGEVSIFLDTYVHHPDPPQMEIQPVRDQLDRLEIAVSFAATLSKELISRGYSVSLTAYTPELTNIPPGKGTRHLLRVLRELALLEPSRDKDVLSLFSADVSQREYDTSDDASGGRKEIKAALRNAVPIVIVLGSHQAAVASESSVEQYAPSASAGGGPASHDKGEHEELRYEAESTLNIANRIARLHPSAKVYDVSDQKFQSVFQYEIVQSS